MSRRIATAVAVLGLAGLLPGCATVTSGTTQALNIDSEPQAADCTLLREGVTLGTVTTPAPLTIKRHASTIQVVCRKAGYEDTRIVMNSRFESASAGNFVLGGIIGVMVDSSTGADRRYESNVLVRLTPLSAADQAVAAAKPKVVVPVVAAPAPPAPPDPSAPRMFTGPWTATAVVIAERSASGCTRNAGTYSFNLANDTLTVDNAAGRAFSVAVPADGAIKQSFKSPVVTATRMSSPQVPTANVDMIGNARTRDLEIVDSLGGCRWRLKE